MRLKSSLLLAIFSICLGFFSFLIFRFSSPIETFTGGGCIILAFDEEEDDRLIQQTLYLAGFNNFVSESSVEVALDDFGVIRMITLDSFRSEIELFDPRDNGYAARLRTFFVREGERFFYYHFDESRAARTRNLERQLNQIFPNTPFTLTVLGQRRHIIPDFILLFAACIAAFVFCRSRLFFFFQVPVLLSFVWIGPGGIALAALLAGIWELLREPLMELSAASRYKDLSSDYDGEGINGLFERLKPFKTNFVLIFLFLFFFLLLIILALLPILPILIGCSFLFLINYLYYHFESNTARKSRHTPFIPVLLYPLKTKTFSLFPFLLPFAFLSLPSILLYDFFSAPMENITSVDHALLISPEEYYRHMELAHSFSYKVFNYELNQFMPDEAYLSYNLGDDGLIAENFIVENTPWSYSLSYPSFPLEKLMLFLLNYNPMNVRRVNGSPHD